MPRVPLPPPPVVAAEPARGGSVGSLAFWLCLFISAVLYAACSLAPRAAAWSRLDHEFRANQAGLIALQGEVRQLQRVADALEGDPAFAGRVARTELKTHPRGAEVIAVPQELQRDPRRVDAAAPAVVAPAPWYLPPLEHLAADGALRVKGLWLAAGLFLAAFLLLNDGVLRRLASLHAIRSMLRKMFSRYLIANEDARSPAAPR